MLEHNRAVPVLLPLFLLLGCADDHRVTGPDEAVVLDVLASTSSATEYEVVRPTHPFQFTFFAAHRSWDYVEVASWINSGSSLNEDGWITGRVGPGAAIWHADRGVSVLEDMAGYELCHGAAINVNGDVAGYCWDTIWYYGSRPVYWDGQTHQALPLSMTVDGKTYERGAARSINAAGQIAGLLDDDTKPFTVVWSDPHADPVRLAVPEGMEGGRSHPHGINDRGDVVGSVDGQPVAWLLNDGEYSAIALPGGGRTAWSINNERDIVGGAMHVEPYPVEWGAPPWQPGVPSNGWAWDSRLWLYQGEDSWLVIRSEDLDHVKLNDITPRVDGTIQVAGISPARYYPMLWTFDTTTGRMLSEQQLEYPAGWFWQSRCHLRAVNSRGLIAGNCAKVQGGNGGPWEIVVWRPLGEPDPGDPGDPSDPGDPEDPPPGDDPAPVASFTYSCNNTATCTFTDTSTGAVVSWEWEFANAEPGESSDQHPSATFKDPGSWAVKLIVTDNLGQPSEEFEAKVTCTIRGQLRCR